MIEKFKISVWDLLTFFVSGLLIIITIKYYKIDVKIDFDFPISNTDIIKETVYLILAYTIGIIFEPISNFLFAKLINIYEWKISFKKLKRLTDERDKVYYPEVVKIGQEKFGFIDTKTDYYQVARTYLVQKNVETLYMTFLAKFGFYRNLSILLFINSFLFPIYKHSDFSITQTVLTTATIFTLHLFSYIRGREFYLYTGNEIFRNFIMLNR